MFIDTHCHLSVEDYDDINLVIKENKAANVDKIIISGCSKEWIDESLELSKKFDDVYVTLGYHPSEVGTVTDDLLNELKVKLSSEKVVGLGEIGLDYYYVKIIKKNRGFLEENLMGYREYKQKVKYRLIPFVW